MRFASILIINKPPHTHYNNQKGGILMRRNKQKGKLRLKIGSILELDIEAVDLVTVVIAVMRLAAVVLTLR